MNTTTNPSIVVDESGVKAIERMQRQATLVDAVWRRHQPDWAAETTLSLSKALSQLLMGGWGTMHVFPDGDTSLFVRTDSIVFGIIGHPIMQADHAAETDPRSHFADAPRAGRYCWAPVEAGRYCTAAIWKGEAQCEGHTPVVFSSPVPMTWSFHS